MRKSRFMVEQMIQILMLRAGRLPPAQFFLVRPSQASARVALVH